MSRNMGPVCDQRPGAIVTTSTTGIDILMTHRLVCVSFAAGLILLFGSTAVAQNPSSESQKESQGENPSNEKADETSQKDFKTLVNKGKKAYKQQDWSTAGRAFEQAYEAKNVANLLYNAGRMYENAGELEKAISMYEKFINQPGIDIKNRKDALDRIQTLQEVVDLREKGKDVEKEDVQQKQSDRGLAEAEKTESSDTQASGPQPDYTLASVLLATGGTSLIAGSVFAILAGNAHSEYQSADTLSTRRGAANRGQTFSVLADTLLVSGLVISAAGGGLFIWPIQTESGEGQQASVRPVVSPETAGLKLRIDF